MKRIIIALIWKKGSGKDTFFHSIKEQYPKAKRFAFADPLKEEFIDLYNEHNHDLENPLTLPALEKNKEFYRKGLQDYWGLKRMDNDNYFIDKLFDKIIDSWTDINIITDMRFQKEQQELLSFCGREGYDLYFIRIQGEDKGDTHISELGVDSLYFDFCIKNEYDFTYEMDCNWIMRIITNLNFSKDWVQNRLATIKWEYKNIL